MKPLFKFSLAAASALALAACGQGAGGTSGSRDFVRAVGSSTVYPFAKAVSENFSRDFPEYKSPVIEAIGSGAGIASFCEGEGPNTPDIANASRRMKPSEFQTCQANGVDDIVEIQVGLDGIAFAAAKNGIKLNLTPEIVYEALAANPYGQPQTAKNWSDVDPSLPDMPILVYGPPSTSGTRDALKELVLQEGCESNAEMAALKESNEDQYDRVCTEVRSDGAYVDQGEQDNLIVQKIESNPNSVGIFGFSYLEKNLDRLAGLPMNGVQPTYENIASFEYPGARPLYMYVKKTHINAIPGLKEFLAQWPKMWGKDGPLARIGLVTSPEDVAANNLRAATEYTSLDGSQL